MWDLLLDKNKNWLASTLSSVADAIVTTDQSGVVTFCNDYACALIGLEMSEIIGRSFHDVFTVYIESEAHKLLFFDCGTQTAFYTEGLPKGAYLLSAAKEKIYLSAKMTVLQSKVDGFLGFVSVFRNITNIIATEMQVQREKESLERMFDILPTGMVILNRELKVVKVNPTFLKAFHQVESDVYEKTLGEAIRCAWRLEKGCGRSHRCKFCEFRELIARLNHENQMIRNERVEITVVKGERYVSKWVNVNVMPISLEDNWCYLMTVDDVTDNVYHERALEEARNNSLLLLDNLPVMIFRYSSNEECTFVNQTFRGYLEMTAEVGAFDRYLEDKMSAEDYTRFRRHLNHCFYEHKVCKFETAIRSKEGEHRSMLTLMTPLIEDELGLAGVIGIFLDIHATKTAKALYEKSQTKYRLLFENLESSMSYHRVIKDESDSVVDFEILETNPATEQLFGETSAGWKGKMLSEISSFPEALKVKLLDHFGKALADNVSIRLSDLYFEPIKKWIDISIYSPEKDYVAVLASDVDFQKRAELELKASKERFEEASRAKSDFLANMSHEIRTPLNGIVGMIDLTLLEALSEEQRENLYTAKDCVKTLMDIINDVLEFSKIEAGKLTIKPENIDVKALIDATVKPHVPHAEIKAVELGVSYLTPMTPLLVGDGKRIRQVLNNLISNAVKFTEKGSVDVLVREEVTAMLDTFALHVKVVDTGIGIPESKQHQLFKSFTQIDGSYTRQYGGTGLGLVISKQLIELMGGAIDFKSEPGRGSTFEFSVPLKLSTSFKKESDVQAPKIEHFEGVRLLLVEDDRVNQVVMKKILDRMKITVDYAENGKIAVTKWEENVYDLIFMDIQMPEMDGIAATKRIRTLEKRSGRKKTPIIALTAYALEGDEAIFMASGMDGYMSKPVQSATLTKVIKKYTKSPEVDVLLKERIEAFEAEQKLKLKAEDVHKAKRRLEMIFSHLAVEDWGALESEAHGLKQTFEKMGAEELKQLAFKMELEIRKERLSEATTIAEQIKNILGMFEYPDA